MLGLRIGDFEDNEKENRDRLYLDERKLYNMFI